IIVALFAVLAASYPTSSSATTVLLKVTLPRSCAPILSSAAFAFAIALFIEASTASGVCSQSGSVNTAFAFAAAGRKSSTVFSSVPKRFKIGAAKMSEIQRGADFMRCFDIRVKKLKWGHRFTQILRHDRRNFAESAFHLC